MFDAPALGGRFAFVQRQIGNRTRGIEPRQRTPAPVTGPACSEVFDVIGLRIRFPNFSDEMLISVNVARLHIKQGLFRMRELLDMARGGSLPFIRIIRII